MFQQPYKLIAVSKVKTVSKSIECNTGYLRILVR